MKQFRLCALLECILTLQLARASNYEYVAKKMTLSDADKFCKERESEISKNLSTMAIVQQCPDIEGDLWTSSIIYATPYVSLLGCFEQEKEVEYNELNVTSIIDCQNHCFNNSAFSIADTKCACLVDLSSVGKQVDPHFCNITCDGTYCGGKNVTNVYVTVEKEFFKERTFMRNQTNFMSCLTTQCIGETVLYMETDCQTEEEIESACNSFFSCTFEPGDPCFLFQSQADDFDWTITKDKTFYGPEKAYQGSYFVFVNDTDNSTRKGKKATLASNITISGASIWCLRFRYHLQNISISASLKVIAQALDGMVILEEQFSYGEFQEWNYTELEINIPEKWKVNIFFQFNRGEATSNFALDDVTLTEGKCAITMTKVLLMTENLKCDFEANKDVCFDQSPNDNFDWTITRDEETETGGTGPQRNIEGFYFCYIDASDPARKNGHKAVLVSRFDLNDVNSTLSFFYNMRGRDINTLELYTTNKTKLFNKTGNQGADWMNTSITTFIRGSQKLFISANVNGKERGDIAIDDIQIKINQAAYPHTWLRSSAECARKVASYLIPHTQLGITRCSFFEGKKRWTGIVRPHQRSTTADLKAKGWDPTWVQTFSARERALVWEPYNNTMVKSFFCVRVLEHTNLPSGNDTCMTIRPGTDPDFVEPLGGRPKSYRGIVIGVMVAVVVIIIFAIVVVIVFKRRLKLKIQQKMDNLTMTNITYERQNDVITVDRTYSKNSKSPDGDQDQEEFYINQQPVQSDMTDRSTEGDYDHLHALNDTKPLATDDVYSHMTDDQYGFHQRPEADTFYGHPSLSLTAVSDYGAAIVDVDGSNTYDHTALINADSSTVHTEGDYDHLHATNTTKPLATDNVYSHMTDDQYGLHQKPEADTFFGHSSFGLTAESDYGTAIVENDGSNTYDHTSSINAASV